MKHLSPLFHGTVARSLFDDLDYFFDSHHRTHAPSFSSPQYDIQENENYVLVSFDLPGLTEDDFQIELRNSVLEVSGERKNEAIQVGVHQLRARPFGRFKKNLRLPNFLESEKIEASYDAGVLRIYIPKKEQARPRKIEVKAKKGNFFSQLLNKDKTES